MKKIILILFVFLFAHTVYSETIIIQSIEYKGHKRTRESILAQEMLFETNQSYSESEWTALRTNSEQNLLNLSIFSSAEISTTPAGNQQSNLVDVTVNVSERWTLFPVPAYYYDNKLGNVLGFVIIEFNLFGMGQHLLAQGLYNPGFNETILEWNYPKVAGTDYYTDFKLTYRENFEYAYSNSTEIYKAWTTVFYQYFGIKKEFNKWGQKWQVYIDSDIEVRTNQILINQIGKSPRNGVTWTFGLGLTHGTMNRKIAATWGNDNEIWIGFTPRGLYPQLKAQHEKFWRLGDLSCIGYRVKAFANPGLETQLDSLVYIRGIKLGDVRGNYGIYGNLELRPKVLTLNLIGGIDIYTPVFFDFGNAFSKNERFNIHETVFIAGFGLRLYSKKIGGQGNCVRLDFGFNLNTISEESVNPISDAFFMAFGVQELF